MHPTEFAAAQEAKPIAAIEAEQSVLGALLLDNNSLDRVDGLVADHFYRAEHRTMFLEIVKQISSGKTCDVISLFDALRDKLPDTLAYINSLAQNTPSAANIRRYSELVTDRGIKRALVAVAGEAQDLAATTHLDAATVVDQVASKIEALAQQKTSSEPVSLSESLVDYVDLLTARMNGGIKPIATGFADLDSRLDGGLERGTLTVVAGRPGMGKTAFGLCIARNVATWGASAVLSMEMSKAQINDRNISALGKLPLSWLKKPTEQQKEDTMRWAQVTHAFQSAQAMNMYIDDQTALTMLAIRSKARSVKRKIGLDLLMIDQLNFITGAVAKDNKSYEIGEYTRGLLSLAKELNCAVLLLAQLNRDCEKRTNRRPLIADLSSSGSIEQDAANIILMYRDEVYNPDSQEKGVCEINCAKQRQGEPGIVALTYIGSQTRFEDLAFRWVPPSHREEQPKQRRGFN
jgi:replicative DNA helicase